MSASNQKNQGNLSHAPSDGPTDSSFTFSPGEENIYVSKYSPSVLLFWLKMEMTVTSRRFLARTPNTLLGLIPLGFNDAAMPLSNVSDAGVSAKFKFGRFLLGIVWIALAIALHNIPVLMILFILLGVASLLNTMSTVFVLRTNSGSTIDLEVSVLEKAKVLKFRQELEQRLFADHDKLRHHESMNMHQGNANMNQAQMAQLLAHMQQQQAMQWQQVQANGAHQATLNPEVPQPMLGGPDAPQHRPGTQG